MTIIIGALCQDGVVVGSDSAATSTAGGIRIVEQPTQDKIRIINERLIIAGSGSFGLLQRFVSILELPGVQGVIPQKRPIDAVVEICKCAVQNFAGTMAPAGDFGALFAFESQGAYQLCEFAQKNFQPELRTPELCFAAMGSGQLIVDPFLALLRKVFWSDRQPFLHEGVFAVTWALDHVIAFNPGGINGPARLAVLTREDSTHEATGRFITEGELEEHRGNIEGIENYLRDYRDTLHSNQTDAVPTPPSPPSP